MYLYVTLLVNEQILWLQISIDQIQRVKVFKGQYNLGCIEAGMGFTAKQTNSNINNQPVSVRKYFSYVKLKSTYLNLPILLKCENISPPGTYSIIIYRLLLSYRETSKDLL